MSEPNANGGEGHDDSKFGPRAGEDFVPLNRSDRTFATVFTATERTPFSLLFGIVVRSLIA